MPSFGKDLLLMQLSDEVEERKSLDEITGGDDLLVN